MVLLKTAFPTYRKKERENINEYFFKIKEQRALPAPQSRKRLLSETRFRRRLPRENDEALHGVKESLQFAFA